MSGARRFQGARLVLASHNAGKLREIETLLADLAVAVVSARALGLPEPEETGDTFVANALIKAHAAATATGLPALADDSGLAVEALGGAPGVHSARWAGKPADFGAAMARVHHDLGDDVHRRARFVAVLALAWPDGHAEVVEGVCDGHLVWPPRGTGGFGYDPMFAPEGSTRTFGEMSAQEKHAVSHRARALVALRERCF